VITLKEKTDEAGGGGGPKNSDTIKMSIKQAVIWRIKRPPLAVLLKENTGF